MSDGAVDSPQSSRKFGRTRGRSDLARRSKRTATSKSADERRSRNRDPRRALTPLRTAPREQPAPRRRDRAGTAPQFAPACGRSLAVAGLLVLHYALAARSLLRENPTVDEVAHLPAGVTYWQKGTFKLYHHNPPLFKLVAALPVVMAGPRTERTLPVQELEVEVPLAADLLPVLRLSQRRPISGALPARPTDDAAVHRDRRARRLRLVGPALWKVGGPLEPGAVGLLPEYPGACAAGHVRRMLDRAWASRRRMSSGDTCTSRRWRWAVAAGILLGVAQLSKFSMLLLYAVWPFLWLAASGDRRAATAAEIGARGAPYGTSRGASSTASRSLR